MTARPIIGIVGGVGPAAGLDLARKVLQETGADRDQAHIHMVLLSFPAEIPDRTAFLQGRESISPGHAIGRLISTMADLGASVVGIPCNTAHASPIFNVILESTAKLLSRTRVLHMIDETALALSAVLPPGSSVGLLATRGTYDSGVYPEALGGFGLETRVPNLREQAEVHEAIYNSTWGIKAQSDPATRSACSVLARVAGGLHEQGAQVIVQGCSEIALAVGEFNFPGIPWIDPARCLARALIRESCPHKLKASSSRGGIVQPHRTGEAD